MSALPALIDTTPLILAECAIAERLRRDEEVELHPTLFITPLIQDEHGRRKLKEIYRQYRDIAARAGLPVLLCAPTWRVDSLRLKEAGYTATLLDDAVDFMRNLQEEWKQANSPVVLGALLAPKNDCYRADLAPDEEEAAAYHDWQIDRLADNAVDCIIAQSMPAVGEALGMARVLSHQITPYIISFVIDRYARVLDGTRLIDAIEKIDSRVQRPPLGYMVNCVYPTFLQAEEQPQALFQRLVGIQANSSSKDHTELDSSPILHRDDLKHWGEQMLRLNNDYGVKILGGCCGTDDRYMRFLAENWRYAE